MARAGGGADDVAVVTGGAGDLGLALARGLAQRGVTPLLVDVDADRLAGAGDPAWPRVAADVRHDAGWARVDEALGDARLRWLVHNAGLTVVGDVASLDADALRRVVDVDLVGPMLGTRALLPRLRAAAPSRLVFVSSMSAFTGLPLQAPYCAAKAGLRAFGQAMAVELCDAGVSVTTVLPGTIGTGFLHRAGGEGPRVWLAERMGLVGRSPEGAAAAILRAAARGRREAAIGLDAVAVGAMTRAAPWALPAALRGLWRASGAWR